MAMKVTKTAIHRLSVDMSCGCKMYAEFADPQCKESLIPYNSDDGESLPTVFTSCEKHKTQDVIEFIISERLEEAVEAAQATPLQPTHQFAVPEPHDIQSSTLSGATVQSVAQVKPEIRQRSRPEDPTKVKTLVRGGGAPQTKTAAMEMGMEVEEDETISGSIEDVLAGLSDLDKDDEAVAR